MLGGSSGVFCPRKKSIAYAWIRIDSLAYCIYAVFLNSSLVEDHALIHHPPTPTPSTGKSSTKVTKLAYLFVPGAFHLPSAERPLAHSAHSSA